MNIIFTIIVDLICDVVWVACPFMFLKFKKNTNYAKPLSIILISLYVLTGLYSRFNEAFYNNFILKALLSFGLLLLLYLLCFEDKISLKILVFVIYCATFVLVEVAGVAVSLLLNINYKEENAALFLIIIAVFIQYLVLLLFRNIYRRAVNKIKLSSNIFYFDTIIIAEFFAGLTISYMIYLNPNFSSIVLLDIRLCVLLGLTAISMIVADIALYRILIVNAQNFELKRDLETATYKSQLELEYYKNMQKNIEETNKLNHDMTNLVSSINALINTNKDSNIKEAQQMSEDLYRKLAETKTKQYCVNELVNLIIINKREKIQESNIEFTTNIDIPYEININNTDLCSIFTNIIDNAIDASIASSDQDKTFIVLNADYNDNTLSIKCSNYSDNKLNIVNNKLQTTKQGHKGIGVEILRSICKKYSGTCMTDYNDNIFTINLLLHTNTQ